MVGLMKQGAGGHYLQVGVKGPNDSAVQDIPSTMLASLGIH